MGIEQAGGKVKGLSSNELMDLFKVYEAKTAHLHVNDKKEDPENVNPQDELGVSAPLTKKTKVDIAPTDTTQIDTAPEIVVEEVYTKEQCDAFYELKERASKRSDAYISPNSTPARVEFGMVSEKGIIAFKHDAVTCLAKLNRIEQKEAASRAAQPKLGAKGIPDELSK